MIRGANKKWVCFMSICALMVMPVVEQVMPFEGVTIVAEAASTKGVKLNKTSLKLVKGKSYTLKVANAGRKKVKWSSKKKKVATVNSKGRVVAKGKGTTYIYAKVGGKTLKCKVTVSVPAPKLNKSSVTINKGKSYTLKVSNASSKVKWSVKNKKVATVTSKGKIIAKGKGTTHVYAKVGKKTLKCKVTVKEPAVVRKYTIDSGKSKSLTFSGATSKTRWKVSDPSIATLSSSKGRKVSLRVRKSGKVTVTATTSGRKTYQFVITVRGKSETLPSKPSTPQTEAPQIETNPPVETEKPLPPQTETNPPQTETNPPQTETNPPQPETPKPPIETEEPETEDKPPVVPPNSNEVYDAELDLPSTLVGDTGRVNVYPVSGMEGYVYGINYSSSNPAVASVDSSGNIECLAEGTTVITVKGDDGVTIDKFTVTVTKTDTGEKPLWEIKPSSKNKYVSGGDLAEIMIETSLSVDRISYKILNVNKDIPEITYFRCTKPSPSTLDFSFRAWLKGDYIIEFSGEGKTDRVTIHVTSSDPDWVEYNNWLYGKLANEWKADSPLNTFLKMGAWLADNRDYDASNTQFQKLYYMGGDCRAAEMLFTDVANRKFKDLKAYSSNSTGGGHTTAIVEIGNDKWSFDAGQGGLAGKRSFSALNMNTLSGYYYNKSAGGWEEINN